MDIIGFKSFAEKTNIEFVPGVTAVVGPNGSGKSNVTDAIRWVLGEQSAKSLRGGKMEDVIFAGSDSRKQLNYAEVTLTLNNEDGALPIEYNEVSVTRRVFRSGESEYLLNRQSCRLKDIVDLFMDSGLGKEAFSIISQGKVEEILNSKPEERRTIFEEAAGVLKYKMRKKKAETKLHETAENLQRVNDIIHELEGQVEPLKIQASIANDYLQKKAELENYEVALTVYEIDTLHKSWEQFKGKVEQLQARDHQLAEDVQKSEAELTVVREQLIIIDETISQLQSELLSATKELEKLEGRRDVLRERKKNATDNTAQLTKNIHDAEEKIEQLEMKKKQLVDETRIKQKAAEQLKNKLKQKKEQVDLFDGSIEETIESLKSDYIERLNEQASAKNEHQYLEQQKRQQQVKAERLDRENEKYIAERNEVTAALAEKQKQLKVVEDQLSTQLTSFQETDKKISELKKQVDEQASLVNQAHHYLQKSISRKETLEEMEDDYIGFFQGVREVLKAREKKLTGIEGAVAELIQVPKKFELAIETALGSTVQHVVVQTEADGRRAIEYLRENRYGRATFLPLNIIKEKRIQHGLIETLAAQSAFVGVAADVIQYAPEHAPAIRSLLGTTIVADRLAGANALAKLLQYRYRIVTLEGDIVNPGGSMTGGATQQKAGSLLSRKSELEELTEKIAMMREKTANLEARWQEVKEALTAEEKQLEAIRESGEQLRKEQNNLEANILQITVNKKNVDERLSLYDLEKNELDAESSKISARMHALKTVLEDNEKKADALNQQIAELTARRDHERISKESLREEVSNLTAEYAVMNEQLSSSANYLKSLNKELKEAKARKTSLVDDLHWLENEMSGHFTSEEELAAEALKKKADKDTIEQKLTHLYNERTTQQATIAANENECKQLKNQYKAVNDLLVEAEIQTNRLDVELENRLQKLREVYRLSYEGAKEQYQLQIAADEAAKKVTLIKREIEELGTVNLGAIEEYERISERYQFLAEQQADLAEAKNTLLQVMAEMDEEMKKRFSSTFNAIKAHFEGVFQALFGGGKAQLKLTEPDDLLRTGVDIVAQPPGKKLQNLSLLSGGERSLTAIALLFSIIKVRPVPFCVLDEVEAALDEANVYRFSQYLQKFSNETQFIVITHRQGTMQGADVLYGVTMQESGVSKLVSVKLQDQEEMATI
nr:chromosome segregation protein SMC [Bacillus sp. FJAT-50079]